MYAVAGFFPSAEDAVRAARTLPDAVPEARVRIVVGPGAAAGGALETLPSDDAEAVGTGAAIGAVVGGAAVASAAAAVIPLAAPFAIVGIAASGLLGGGAGLAAGRTLERSLSEGLPQDEVVRWRDAVERGGALVVAYVEDDMARERACSALAAAGATETQTP